MNGFEGLDLSALMGDPDKRAAQLAALRNQQMQGQILGGSSVGGGSVSNLGRQMMTNANSQMDKLGTGGLKNTLDLMKSMKEVGAPNFEDEMKLRKEFLDQNKDFSDYQRNWQNIQTAMDINDAASDISLIFSYMKMQDPASTVREGEFATAENAGNIASSIISAYNKLISGKGRLDPAVRNQFANTAGKLYNQAVNRYQSNANKYRGYAKQYNFDPNRIANAEEFELYADKWKAKPEPYKRGYNDPIATIDDVEEVK
jgi:hypothetical protein